jgi:NAD(P)H-dependent FMN reductase
MSKYENTHTKAWSDKIKKADAYIFLTPEYTLAIQHRSRTQ